MKNREFAGISEAPHEVVFVYMAPDGKLSVTIHGKSVPGLQIKPDGSRHDVALEAQITDVVERHDHVDWNAIIAMLRAKIQS